MYRKAPIIFLLLLAPALSAQVSLLKNPGFEEGTGTFPDFWAKNCWNKAPGVTEYEWLKQGGRTGGRCVLIRNNEINDARIVQVVQLAAKRKYRFSVWVKTDNISREGIGANLSALNKWYASEGKHGSIREWEEIVLYIDNTGDAAYLSLSIGIGTYQQISTGSAWFDDAQLTRVDSIPGGARILTVNENAAAAAANNTANTNRYQIRVEWNPPLFIISMAFAAGIIFLLIVILRLIILADKKSREIDA